MFAHITDLIFLLMAVEAMPRYFYTSPDVNVQCTSYGGLCDVSYVFGDSPIRMPSSEQMCTCPGNTTCPIHENDPTRVLNLQLQGSQMTLRLSYCDAKATDLKPCQFGEHAVTLEGGSPFALTVVGNIRCSCSEALVLDSAKPDGAYFMQTYTCGKKTCAINKSSPPVCERQHSILTLGGIQTSTEVPCLCPTGFACTGSNPGFSPRLLFGGQVEKTCEVSQSRW